MKLKEIHNCQKSRGRNLKIEIDRENGRCYCDYCGKRIYLEDYFKEEFELEDGETMLLRSVKKIELKKQSVERRLDVDDYVQQESQFLAYLQGVRDALEWMMREKDHLVAYLKEKKLS